MQADVTIEVRFKTAAEGGRKSSVIGKTYGCPMFIAGDAYDCRLLIGEKVLELGRHYEVPVKFLNSDSALQRLVLGQAITLWAGKTIAEGKILRLGT